MKSASVFSYVLTFLTALISTAAAEEFAPLFPFVVSHDFPQNLTNLAGKLDAPAGKHGFVRVKDEKLITDAGPIRFWGTNLCFSANFPSSEQAEQLAQCLARFGFNCVRLHHMDTGSDSLVTGKPGTLTELDTVKLDALDRLIATLKKYGIYVDINLHVGRWFDERDGFPFREQRPDYDKGVGNYEPRMIELQKKYARDLLTHVNPYTKLAYINDPCVAFVEISNEDSIIRQWNGGGLDHLPEPYAGVLQKLWNGWLEEKYQTDEKLCESWNCKSYPLRDEMFVEGDFTDDKAIASQRLTLHTDEKSLSELWLDEGVLKIKVSKKGAVSWIPQLYFRRCQLDEGKPYTMTLKIRANKETSVTAGIFMDHDPWESLGVYAKYAITPEWQTISVPFYSTATDETARFTLSSLEPDTIYEIDMISLRSGGEFGLAEAQSLQEGTVPLVLSGKTGILPRMYRDFCEFLIEIEQEYWGGMYNYVKNDLKTQSLVIGTQLNYGSTHVQAQLDFCDNHAYWNHPVFTEKPWDMNHWYISNRALVNHLDTGTLTGLAACRVAGLPYTVSEYDHPFPNLYGAEGNPMLAAMARFQNWSGIFPFAYSHSAQNSTTADYVSSFFDMAGNTGDLVHALACYAMFERGDLLPAEKTYTVGMTKLKELEILAENRNSRVLSWKGLGADERLALMHGIVIDLNGKTSDNIPVIPVEQKIFTSDTGEIRVDMSRHGRGNMTVSCDKVKLFTGFVPDEPFHLKGLTLKIGKTRLGWATVTATTINGDGFGENGKPAQILLAATGEFRNTDMKLQHLQENRVTLGRDFGKGPILCEGIPAEITFPVDAERVTVFALNPSGNRAASVPVKLHSEGKAVFSIGPEFKTVWYEINIK
ncbi:MAG: hypothetical protein LBQ54_07405 [Planctomycetaceae bacterium]|jgi:hypothetical protein|nr:hypothetical protein [Planctomycetaceae bacterium]